MVIIMNMESGKHVIEDEFGAFEEEVLNAECQPRPELQLGLQEAIADHGHHAHGMHTPLEDGVDPEVFIRDVYANQE